MGTGASERHFWGGFLVLLMIVNKEACLRAVGCTKEAI